MNNTNDNVTNIKAKLNKVTKADAQFYGLFALGATACAYLLVYVIAMVKYVIFPSE